MRLKTVQERKLMEFTFGMNEEEVYMNHNWILNNWSRECKKCGTFQTKHSKYDDFKTTVLGKFWKCIFKESKYG